MGAPKKNKRIDWDQQPLGKINDYELASRLGVTQNSVRKQRVKRGIAPFFQPRDWDNMGLGIKSDCAIAREHGIKNVSDVRAARHRRGIPVFKERFIDWDSEPLGKITDHDLAIKLCIDRTSIQRERKKRGIEPLSRTCEICGCKMHYRKKAKIHACKKCTIHVSHAFELVRNIELARLVAKANFATNLTAEKIRQYKEKRNEKNG